MAKRAKKTVEVNIPADPPKGMLDKLGIVDAPALAAQIVKDFENAEQTKYLWIPQRAEDVKNYFGVTVNAEWPFKGASRVKSQFQRIVVDTFASNLVKSIFLPEHPIKAFPAPLGDQSSNDTLDNLKYVEDLHNSLQNNEYNLKQTLDRAFSTSLIESFVVLHPVYEYLTNEITVSVVRWVPGDVDTNTLSYDLDTDTVATQDGQFVPSVALDKASMSLEDVQKAQMKEVQFDVVKDEVVKDGVSLKMINGYRFYMPLGTPGETPYEKIQRAPYVLNQLFYTLREVRQYEEQDYFENIEPVVATVYDRQRELITYHKLQQAGFLLDTARLEQEYVEVLKWCGKWKINGKWRELTVWMDRGSSQILRAEPNIFGMRPYFPIVPFPVDETPYGESLCKIIQPLVKEIDLLMRIMTNLALMKTAPPRFFDPASGFNPSTIGQFGPNSWIPAREPSRNILIPPQPEDSQVAMQMLQFLINIIERITGINETTQGQLANRANTTATEVQTALIRSGVRFDQIYERVKDQLKPMFKYIHKLTLRYMPDTKEVRLMGQENAGRLTKMHKANLSGQFEFELAGNSIVTEQNELQNALALYNTLGQHPYVSYKPESIYYILYNIVKRLNPIAMNKILPKPEEVVKLERSRQEAQRQQEQQALAHQQQDMQGQGEAAAKQKHQEMQLTAATAQQDMAIKDAEAKQRMTHKEAEHKQKMEQARAVAAQQLIAQKQQAEIQKAEMIRRARNEATKAQNNSGS